jgi:hypothetical protein
VKKYRKLEPIIEEVLERYGVNPYEPRIESFDGRWKSSRSMLPQDIAKAVWASQHKRFDWKHFLNQFHIWRFHWQLYDSLNDKFCVPHFSYQPPGYWTPISDPRAQRAIMNDPVLGKHINEDGRVS